MVRVILNGCGGKMGTVITQISKSNPNISIVSGIDKAEIKSVYPVFQDISECNIEADVILDFSRPNSLEDLLIYAKHKALPIVLCTTGYSEEQIKFINESSLNMPIFRSANMSIGINIVNKVLKDISAFLFKDFDIEIIEKHHNQKVDSPSGTALLLANTIKASIPEDTKYVYGREGIGKREHKDIGIHAVRGGNIVGDHEVIFAGQGEIIEIKHTALSREVFAVGALKACEYMFNKPAGLYSMDNVLS